MILTTTFNNSCIPLGKIWRPVVGLLGDECRLVRV